MGLFPTQQPPTTQQRQAATANRMKARNAALLKAMVDTFAENFNDAWNHKSLTPQQVFDAFGIDASQWFIYANLLATMVNTIQPGTITLAPPNQYTINNDGTVTVGDPVQQ